MIVPIGAEVASKKSTKQGLTWISKVSSVMIVVVGPVGYSSKGTVSVHFSVTVY